MFRHEWQIGLSQIHERRNGVRRSESWRGFWKARVTLCSVCAESLNLTGLRLVKWVLMLLVQEENGFFGSLDTWPLSVQILSILPVLIRFYLQPFQLSLARSRGGRRLQLGKRGGEGTASCFHCFIPNASWKWRKVFWHRVFNWQTLKEGLSTWWKLDPC